MSVSIIIFAVKESNKVMPINEALANSEADGCWALV
jgi:hypothetical protein